MFSVVVPTYNRAGLLRSALDSVVAQEWDDWELIVVDDGSSDDTPAVVSAHGARVTYLRQENRGPAAARNLAIERARGRYVCPLDSDDLWFPWTLAAYASAISEAASPTMLVGELRSFHDPTELLRVPRVSPVVERWPDFLSSSCSGTFVGSGHAVYERRALLRVGGFDCKLLNCEDHDLALRLGTDPGFVRLRAPAAVGHRRHPGSVQTPERSASGLLACLARERAEGYPGGAPRARERRRILTLHARPLSLSCAARGRLDLAWRLYAETLAWNAHDLRARYLLGFPLLSARARVLGAWR